jgi:tetratricopeptide (TPR) repeat protein
LRRKTFKQAFSEFGNLTLNNLANLERREGNQSKALKYLERSKDNFLSELSTADAAVTYLNLSAVLSELNQHQDAEQAAMLAVQKSEQDILSLHSTTMEE